MLNSISAMFSSLWNIPYLKPKRKTALTIQAHDFNFILWASPQEIGPVHVSLWSSLGLIIIIYFDNISRFQTCTYTRIEVSRIEWNIRAREISNIWYLGCVCIAYVTDKDVLCSNWARSQRSKPLLSMPGFRSCALAILWRLKELLTERRKCITQQYLCTGKDECLLHRFFVMKVPEVTLVIWLTTLLYKVLGDTGK